MFVTILTLRPCSVNSPEALSGCGTCGNNATNFAVPHPPFNNFFIVAMRMCRLPHPKSYFVTHLFTVDRPYNIDWQPVVRGPLMGRSSFNSSIQINIYKQDIMFN